MANLNLVAPIRVALVADSDITDLLGTYQGNPSIHTRRPVPEQAMYPMLVISSSVAIGDFDGLKSNRPIAVHDVIAYGQKDDSYRVVEELGYLLRNKFHRNRTVISVPSYNVVSLVASGPIPAPVDDIKFIGRVVSLTVQLAET